MPEILNFTLPCPPLALTDFLRFGAGLPRFYFESRQSPLAIAGLGIAAQTFGAGEGRFAVLGAGREEFFGQIKMLNPAQSLPRPAALAGGSFFSQLRPGEWDSFPAAALILPRYTLTRFGGKTFLALNQVSAENESLSDAARRLRLEAENFLARLQDSLPAAPALPEIFSLRESGRADWQAMLAQAIERISAGQMKKVVLARASQLRLTPAPEPAALLAALGEACPACFRFLFEFSPGAAFAGATPERLAAVSGAQFVSAAIAGSIRRGETSAADEALAGELLASLKDQSEHTFVLDEIRARLAPLAARLEFDPAPQILRLPNIQHLRTRVAGQLRAGCGALELAAALHPTPAVGGVPGAAALEFIRAAEGFERGWYAGPVGWVDAAGDGDFAVAIRSGLFRGESVTLFGGAGIVAASDPQKEWEETGLKMRFLLDALQAVTA
ncbi:MAG: isochorismate synthase [Anaerolineales bacterium]